MEIIDVKEKRIKELKKKINKNRRKQDEIREEIGLMTIEEELLRKDPWTTDEEVDLMDAKPEETWELTQAEKEELELMDQITFLQTGKSPRERRMELAMELERKWEKENK